MNRGAITSRQLRIARSLLRWSEETAALKAKLRIETLLRAEVGDAEPVITIVQRNALISLYEAAGIVFTPENSAGSGVHLRKGDA